MPPKTYTVDIQRYRNNLIQWLQNIALGVVFALVGTMAADFALLTRSGIAWALPGLAYALFSMVMVARLARYQNAGRHQLTVGSDGMVLVQHGKSTRWRWSEISQITLTDRSATYTAMPSDGPTTLQIDDIYATPLAAIVAQMNAARDRAIAAAVEAPDTAPEPSTPTIFTISSAAASRQQRTQIWGILLVAIAGAAIFLLLREKAFARLLSGLNNTPVEVFALAGVLIAFSFGMAMAASRRIANFIQVTEEGLTWSHRLTVVRQWRWQDLSSFEIRESGAGGASGARRLVFTAADDGKPFSNMGLSSLFLSRQASTDPTSFAIDATYEAPFEQIAARLNAGRDQALALAPPERTIQPPAAGDPGIAGQPLNFQLGFAKDRKMGVVAWTLAFGSFIWLPIIFLLGWPFDVPGGMEGWAQSPWQWFLRFISFLPLIALIAELLILLREIVPADNMLSLDRNGLTLTRGGRKKLWAWRDLSDFRLEARKVLGLFGPRGVIVFGAPGGRDLRSRFLRLCYRLTGRAPAMVIEDVYDTPLDDIAATLNRYRTEGGTGGPGAVPAE